MADGQTAGLSDGGGAAALTSTDTAGQHDASRQSQATQADRPAYIPEQFWDADKKAANVEGLAGEFKKLSDAAKADQDRRANLPKEPKAYEFKAPEGFKLPEIDGKQAEIDPAAPMWGKLQTLAHQEGWTPDQFSKVAALGLNMQIEAAAAAQQQRGEYLKVEEAKLGDNAKARVEGVHRFVDANFGEDAADVKAALGNAGIVKAFEKMITGLQSSGITTLNGNGRGTGRTDGKPENWEGMSPVDRLTWTRANAPQQSNGASR